MAHTNEYKKLTSKIEHLVSKIQFSKDIYELDIRLLKEKTETKIQKFILKENEKLDLLKFALSDINEEVNKRLPNAMLKYNVKDYWKRRECIQIYRLANYSLEAENAYQERLNQLNALKKQKEEQVRKSIYDSLSSYFIKDENEKNLLINKIEQERKESEIKIKSFTEKANLKLEKQLVKLKENHLKKLEKLNEKLAKNISLRDKFSSQGIVLEGNIVLKVENLTMQFGGLKAVDNLSFDVKKGEIFGLIGPNGAGKTTVFNCITQFYKPTSGNIYFLEKSGNTISLNDYMVHDVIKKGIVRTFQNVEVIKEVSVLENLLIAAHTKYHANLLEQFLHLPILKKEEIALKEKAMEVLDFMGLTMYKDWLAWGLPYGVLKKVEIARTLMNNPQLIILDEPAAGLNDAETAELTKLIKKIQDKFDCTILLIEHDMSLVMDLCDRICAISFGKLLALGSPSEIQNNKDVQAAYLGISEEE